MTRAEADAYLAEKFNPKPFIRREGRSFYIASRTREGVVHRVDFALDGTFVCNCEVFTFRQQPCWAIKAVKEELEMSNQTQELVPVKVKPITSLLPTERDMVLIDKAAQLVFAGAVSLPKELNTREKVAAVMLYGLELGLAPMTAIRHLYIVNGKVQPSTEVMAGLLLSRHPDARLSVEELSNERCVMRLRWPERGVDDTYVVTWEDIKRAGLDQGEVAKKYPQDRMRYHSTKRLLRIYAPDVINGLDQSAPAIGDAQEAVDDEVDEREFYNDGDYVDVEGRVVDANTGEIQDEEPEPEVPDAPRATDEQLAAIRDWQESVKEQRGEPAIRACNKWMATTYAYAIEGGKYKLANLYDVDAEEFIGVLKTAAETGELPAAQGALIS